MDSWMYIYTYIYIYIYRERERERDNADTDVDADGLREARGGFVLVPGLTSPGACVWFGGEKCGRG